MKIADGILKLPEVSLEKAVFIIEKAGKIAAIVGNGGNPLLLQIKRRNYGFFAKIFSRPTLGVGLTPLSWEYDGIGEMDAR